MISALLTLLAQTGPHDQSLSCVQVKEIIETVTVDPYFSRPEKKEHMKKFLERVKRHSPPGCAID